ncbi:putative Proteasome subunit beta type-6 [Cocos nucifera]|uniref:Putative Proteasome subunit beta type-6 n=1 Tax=Cocos nucifera TaxID=13894 RepID=A0A8K0I185_COCNU|nr:putative Proteasome subunit beta type-6 [Cocos nucifera]
MDPDHNAPHSMGTTIIGNMLQMGVIVGGWDKYEGAQIYSVPLGGTILRQPFAIGASHIFPFFQIILHQLIFSRFPYLTTPEMNELLRKKITVYLV